jgi:hypothetical protein
MKDKTHKTIHEKHMMALMRRLERDEVMGPIDLNDLSYLSRLLQSAVKSYFIFRQSIVEIQNFENRLKECVHEYFSGKVKEIGTLFANTDTNLIFCVRAAYVDGLDFKHLDTCIRKNLKAVIRYIATSSDDVQLNLMGISLGVPQNRVGDFIKDLFAVLDSKSLNKTEDAFEVFIDTVMEILMTDTETG